MGRSSRSKTGFNSRRGAPTAPIATKKVAARRRGRVEFEEEIVFPVEPQSRKTFSVKDVKRLTPLTDNQEKAFDFWDDEQNVVMDGFAGTGKSTLAMYFALTTVLDPNTPQKKIVIVRSTAQTRDIGFLKGTEEEKIAPFEAPYRGICDDLFPWKNSYDNLKELGKIEFESTSLLRGITFSDSVIIVDEIQSMTEHELETVITRTGRNSRIIFCGDDCQNDIGKDSGFSKIVPLLRRMQSISFVDFELSDCVRSGFVREFLMAKYQYR